jgi:hypothetical protein
MYKDEIICEVWRNRDDYAKQHHNSLKVIVKDLIRRQKNSYGNVVDRRTKVNCTDKPQTIKSDL